MNETERRYAARRELWSQAFASIDLEGKDVLDAGTGEGHFTRFLAERDPKRLVSITCLEEEIPPARDLLGNLSARVEFHVADLTRMPEISDGSFDVVGGDFLIAAVAAYTPYREIECLKELCRVLRPGGRLVLTGWEVWRECRNRTERTIRDLFKLREGAHHLAGEDPFREHPRHWIESRLADLGMPAESVRVVPDIHHDMEWFLKSVRGSIASLAAEDMRSALMKRFHALAEELRSAGAFDAGFEFGRLYAVTACKLAGGILLG